MANADDTTTSIQGNPSVSQDKTLYLAVSRAGIVQIGTCSECVIHEAGRPAERAEDVDAQMSELDFPRRALLDGFRELGIDVTILDEYVCP
jgi:hypothetical protein